MYYYIIFSCEYIQFYKNRDLCPDAIRSFSLYDFGQYDIDTRSYLMVDEILEDSNTLNVFVKIIDIIFNLSDEHSYMDAINNFPIVKNSEDTDDVFVSVLIGIYSSHKFILNILPNYNLNNYANEHINIIQRSING